MREIRNRDGANNFHSTGCHPLDNRCLYWHFQIFHRYIYCREAGDHLQCLPLSAFCNIHKVATSTLCLLRAQFQLRSLKLSWSREFSGSRRWSSSKVKCSTNMKLQGNSSQISVTLFYFPMRTNMLLFQHCGLHQSNGWRPQKQMQVINLADNWL